MESDVEPSQSKTDRPIWLDADGLKLKEQRREQLTALIEFLESRQGETRELADCLLGHRTSADEPATRMQTLTAQIASECSKEPTHALLQLLGRVVDQRNRSHAFQLPLPGIPVTMPKPIPPFTPARWGELAKHPDWSRAVLADVVRSASPVKKGFGATGDESDWAINLELLVGRMLASAVLWGGLLCRNYLEEFYRSLSLWPEITEYVHAHQRVYMVWFDEAGNCRRWIPDPLTALLLMEVFMAYIRTVVADPTLRPGSLSKFIDTNLLHFQLRLPPCLTQYAAGKLPSASPNPVTWAKMIHRDVPSPSCDRNEPEEPESAASEEAEEEELETFSGDQDDDWVAELRELLGSGNAELTPSRARKAILDHLKQPDLAPEQRLFLAFAANLLEERIRGKLATVRTMVVALATRLPGVIDLANPKVISPDEFAGGYSTILDDAISPNQHDKFRRYLRTWHRWLVCAEGAQEIDEPEVFGTAARAQAVDATLVMEDEYLKVRDSLIDSKMNFRKDFSGEKELRHIAGLVLIFGYRCFLRKYEILKAPLDAVFINHPAEFLVRPWSERRLKTPNAVRKLPLYALLDQDELLLVRAWLKHRREQNGRIRNPSPFLFFSPKVERAFIPEGRIFPVIHEALRSVTGDEAVHFHTLRKSATFLAFALLRPKAIPLPRWLKDWPKQKERIENSATLHTQLYSNSFATRRHLFTVARLLGHSSPSVSIANYLELQGELLSLWLETVPMALGSKQIETIAAVSPRMATNIHNDNVRIALWHVVGKRWRKAGLPEAALLRKIPPNSSCSATTLAPLACQQSPGGTPQELLDVERILTDVFEGVNEEDLEWRSSYPRSFLNALLRAARSAAILTLVAPSEENQGATGAHVHSFRNADSIERRVCPTLVRANQDHAVVARFAPSIFAQLRTRSKRSKFREIAKHWLESRRDERNGLEFAYVERMLAKRYADFLLGLGVAPEECSIRYFGGIPAVQKWKRSIPTCLWEQREPARPESSFKAETNSIGIKLLPLHADTATNGDQISSYGWRYLMLLASLWTAAWLPPALPRGGSSDLQSADHSG
jgi:hypothetical protein